MNSKKAKALRKKLHKAYDDIEDRGVPVDRLKFKSKMKRLKAMYQSGIITALVLFCVTAYADNLYFPITKPLIEFRDEMRAKGYDLLLPNEPYREGVFGQLTPNGDCVHIKTFKAMIDEDFEAFQETLTGV